MSRRGEFLFFASPKKRNQKKGDPAAAPVPSLRCGPPPVRDPDGPAANSPAMQAQTARQACSVWGCARKAGAEGVERGVALGLEKGFALAGVFEAKSGPSAYVASAGSYCF